MRDISSQASDLTVRDVPIRPGEKARVHCGVHCIEYREYLDCFFCLPGSVKGFKTCMHKEGDHPKKTTLDMDINITQDEACIRESAACFNLRSGLVPKCIALAVGIVPYIVNFPCSGRVGLSVQTQHNVPQSSLCCKGKINEVRNAVLKERYANSWNCMCVT